MSLLVYLDNNIVSDIEQGENSLPMIIRKLNLTEETLFPYSFVHILEAEGLKRAKGKESFQKRLKTIKAFSQSYYLNSESTNIDLIRVDPFSGYAAIEDDELTELQRDYIKTIWDYTMNSYSKIIQEEFGTIDFERQKTILIQNLILKKSLFI